MIIIQASLGRCGSTLLTNHIRKSKGISQTFIPRIGGKVLKENTIIKTHDFAPEGFKLTSHDIKCIYLFADPYEIVLSNYDKYLDGKKRNKTNGLNTHFYHLNGDYNKVDLMLKEDVMNLEKNFDSWYKKNSYPVLTIRYKKMWDNIDKINEYLGTSIVLPEYKKRKDYWKLLSENEINVFKETYRKLYEKIENAEDIKLW
ncbi:MAG: hypothetical protein ACOC33_00120 [bacterium]